MVLPLGSDLHRTTRAVVHRSVFDQVRDGLVQMAGYLKVGDPTDMATIIGPVISGAAWPDGGAHR